jgi:virginiamycin B lyase
MRTLALALAALLVAPAAAESVDIKEWLVPWEESRPRDPFAESADSVWFVGQRTGYLARLDAKTGKMTKVDLPNDERPHNLIVGKDGVVWYAGNATGTIGRYDPRSKKIETVAMPDPAARDPHTLIFDDGEENIWFTAQGGNFVGRLNVESRKVDLIPVPTERARPYGIKVGPDGAVWAVLFGANKLAKIDPQSLALAEIALPRAEARPRRLEITSDGRVWYVDYAKGLLGAYDPKAKTFKEWRLPSGEAAKPYGTAADSKDRIWIVETGVQPNRFIGFDPATEEFFTGSDIPSGAGAVRHMHYHATSGSVWFGTDTNFIGRAIVEVEKAQ